MYTLCDEIFCPVCGQIGPKRLSVRNVSDGPFLSRDLSAARDIIHTFKCRCGVTFSHTEHADPSHKPVVVRS